MADAGKKTFKVALWWQPRKGEGPQEEGEDLVPRGYTGRMPRGSMQKKTAPWVLKKKKTSGLGPRTGTGLGTPTPQGNSTQEKKKNVWDKKSWLGNS